MPLWVGRGHRPQRSMQGAAGPETLHPQSWSPRPGPCAPPYLPGSAAGLGLPPWEAPPCPSVGPTLPGRVSAEPWQSLLPSRLRQKAPGASDPPAVGADLGALLKAALSVDRGVQRTGPPAPAGCAGPRPLTGSTTRLQGAGLCALGVARTLFCRLFPCRGAPPPPALVPECSVLGCSVSLTVLMSRVCGFPWLTDSGSPGLPTTAPLHAAARLLFWLYLWRKKQVRARCL